MQEGKSLGSYSPTETGYRVPVTSLGTTLQKHGIECQSQVKVPPLKSRLESTRNRSTRHMTTITQGRWRSSLTELSIYFVTWLKSHTLPLRRNSNKPDVAAGSKLLLIAFKCLLLENINLQAYQLLIDETSPTNQLQISVLSDTWERESSTYLTICVLVNFIISRVVIMLNESKVFFLLSLQCGWSPVNVGRKITLEEQKKYRRPRLLCTRSVKNKWSLPEWPRHMETHLTQEGGHYEKAVHTEQRNRTAHSTSTPTSVINQV